MLSALVSAVRGMGLLSDSPTPACLEYENWYGTRGILDLKRGLVIGASLGYQLPMLSDVQNFGASPDGAFGTFRFFEGSGTFRVIIRPLGSLHTRFLTLVESAKSTSERAVWWSADSRRVALTWRSATRDQAWYLTIANVQTSEVRTFPIAAQTVGDSVELHGWSANGVYLALSVTNDKLTVGPASLWREIRILDSNTGALVYQVSHLSQLPSRGYGSTPWGQGDSVQWGALDDWLAYLRVDPDNKTTLTLVSAHDSRERVYTLRQDLPVLAMLYWSPDGRYVAVPSAAQRIDANQKLARLDTRWQVDVFGMRGDAYPKISTELVADSSTVARPLPQMAWSTDSQRLFYVQAMANNHNDLWALRLSSSESTLIQADVRSALVGTADNTYLVFSAQMDGATRTYIMNSVDLRRFVLGTTTQPNATRRIRWSAQSQWALVIEDDLPAVAVFTPTGRHYDLTNLHPWRKDAWSASADLLYLMALNGVRDDSQIVILDVARAELKAHTIHMSYMLMQALFYDAGSQWFGASGYGVFRADNSLVQPLFLRRDEVSKFMFTECSVGKP